MSKVLPMLKTYETNPFKYSTWKQYSCKDITLANLFDYSKNCTLVEDEKTGNFQLIDWSLKETKYIDIETKTVEELKRECVVELNKYIHLSEESVSDSFTDYLCEKYELWKVQKKYLSKIFEEFDFKLDYRHCSNSTDFLTLEEYTERTSIVHFILDEEIYCFDRERLIEYFRTEPTIHHLVDPITTTVMSVVKLPFRDMHCYLSTHLLRSLLSIEQDISKSLFETRNNTFKLVKTDTTWKNMSTDKIVDNIIIEIQILDSYALFPFRIKMTNRPRLDNSRIIELIENTDFVNSQMYKKLRNKYVQLDMVEDSNSKKLYTEIQDLLNKRRSLQKQLSSYKKGEFQILEKPDLPKQILEIFTKVYGKIDLLRKGTPFEIVETVDLEFLFHKIKEYRNKFYEKLVLFLENETFINTKNPIALETISRYPNVGDKYFIRHFEDFNKRAYIKNILDYLDEFKSRLNEEGVKILLTKFDASRIKYIFQELVMGDYNLPKDFKSSILQESLMKMTFKHDQKDRELTLEQHLKLEEKIIRYEMIMYWNNFLRILNNVSQVFPDALTKISRIRQELLSSIQ